MATVDVAEHGNGDVSLGLTLDGTFVPFVTVSKARIVGLQERAKSLRERAESGDDEEKARVGQALSWLPIEAKSSSGSKSKPKPGGGDS